MTFRIASLEDLDEMKRLFVGTIEEVCNGDYTPSELAQWASSADKTQRWIDLINEQYVVLAEIQDQIVGYASLKDGKYIDFFYVHKDFQRRGIAQNLLDKIQSLAKEKAAGKLSSEISITARPFFEKNGFVVVERQENVRENATLVNYRMEKEL